MLGITEDLDVGLVIKKCGLRSPADPHGMLRIQHQVDGRLQTLRPVLNGTKWSLGPVVLANQAAERSASRQPVRDGGRGWNVFPRTGRAFCLKRMDKAIQDGEQGSEKFVLGDVTGSADFPCLDTDESGIILADDHHLRFRNFLAENAGSLEPIHPRHGHIHEDEIGMKSLGLLDSL